MLIRILFPGVHASSFIPFAVCSAGALPDAFLSFPFVLGLAPAVSGNVSLFATIVTLSGFLAFALASVCLAAALAGLLSSYRSFAKGVERGPFNGKYRTAWAVGTGGAFLE